MGLSPIKSVYCCISRRRRLSIIELNLFFDAFKIIETLIRTNPSIVCKRFKKIISYVDILIVSFGTL